MFRASLGSNKLLKTTGGGLAGVICSFIRFTQKQFAHAKAQLQQLDKKVWMEVVAAAVVVVRESIKRVVYLETVIPM